MLIGDYFNVDIHRDGQSISSPGVQDPPQKPRSRGYWEAVLGQPYPYPDKKASQVEAPDTTKVEEEELSDMSISDEEEEDPHANADAS